MILLSEYQSIMVDAIFKLKGTVDKFIGDAVMADFVSGKNPAMKAIFDECIESTQLWDLSEIQL